MLKKMPLKCPWWSVTKNKTIELDCYEDESFGINLNIRRGNQDHRGFDLKISFWWSFVFMFYDNRHYAKKDYYNV